MQMEKLKLKNENIWFTDPEVTRPWQGYSGIEHEAAIEASAKTLPEETVSEICHHK